MSSKKRRSAINLRNTMNDKIKNVAVKMKPGGGFTINSKQDAHSCPDCASKHGQKFNQGAARPPFHPNCRCTAVMQ